MSGRLATQGAVSAALVAAITLLLYQFPVRLFFSLHAHGVRPYGLAYVVAFALLTVWGGRRLGYLTLLLAILGAALLLPPRSTLAIGDALGWLELGGLFLLGVLTVPAVDYGRRKVKRGMGWLRRGKEWLRRLAGLAYRLYALPGSRRPPPDVLLIYSHMRSGSSLLSHLLFSHPDICGYGETHLTYTDTRDFDALVGNVMIVRRRPPGPLRERYVLDKVLHEGYLDAPRILPRLRGRVHVIFLVREPRGALSSMINTFGHSELQALEHYLARMASIAHAAESAVQWEESGRAVAVTYDQLLQRTEPAFRIMEDHLGLSRPLRQDYEVLSVTGRPKVGDTSANIHSGVILRDGKPALEISAATHARAEEAYQQCLETLVRCCRSLPADTETV